MIGKSTWPTNIKRFENSCLFFSAGSIFPSHRWETDVEKEYPARSVLERGSICAVVAYSWKRIKVFSTSSSLSLEIPNGLMTYAKICIGSSLCTRCLPIPMDPGNYSWWTFAYLRVNLILIPFCLLSQVELFRVLKAYTILNPVDGYFQGQAPVAAMLVMHMPAEEAFWCLVAICERYLPGYYSQGLVNQWSFCIRLLAL